MSKSIAVALALVLVVGADNKATAFPPVVLLARVVCLQDDPTAKSTAGDDKSSTDPEALKKLLERIGKLETEVERLKQGQPAAANAPAKEGQVLTLVDIAHIGTAYSAGGQSRYAAIRVTLANTTGQPVTLTREQVTAEIEGEARKLESIPAGVVGYSFQHGKFNYSLQSMQPAKSWKVPAGGQNSFWLVYPGLPVGTAVPKCKLKLTLGDVMKEIDVNEVQRAVLGLESERIGPRGSLALLTITGTMTPFNTQSLIDEMDKQVAQKVARVVLRWSPDAPQPDGQMLNWLNQSTAMLGQTRNGNEQFPAIPGALREFHLVKFSDNDGSADYSGYRGNSAPLRIHKSAAEAVGSALRTAYLALPRDELLQEIREGHALTRAAALAYGGGRLDAEHLPQIFQWIEDKDPEVQKAALQALSHFGEPEAVEKLVHYAKRNVEPLSSAAIESLAGSRFGAAHQALISLLKNEEPESKKRIVQVLAKYPRPVWSDTLYEFAADPRAGLHLDAVEALTKVGHPNLVDILEAGLKSSEKPLKDFAFQTLANRTDERSEQLAVEFTLIHLKESPPDGNMIQLLSRTKDARALPLLLEQLERNKNDQSSVLNLLVQIGDKAVADKLAEKYPSLKPGEQALVLNGLKQFRHPKFREFAGAALLASDSALVSIAANSLQQEGHPDGEKLLIEALDKQTTAHLINNITNALANFGTQTARAALLKAQASTDTNKQNYARSALLQMRQRSPGFQYFLQAEQRLLAPVEKNNKAGKAEQEKDALEFYEMAIQLDPQLAEAYAGRGKLKLRQNKLSDAGRDFEKALELKLEPDSEVITGLALARVVDGRLDDGIRLVEDNRGKFKMQNQGLYPYNAACVYSRACEYLDAHADVPDRDKKRDDYRQKALADLAQSIKQGFDDFNWMAEDPDLAALRADAEFKKLLASKSAQQPDSDKPKED
jgi:HEAT repeat protein